MELTIAQAAYVAGAIDGEGSIAVYAIRSRCSPTATPAHCARVTICNTKLSWLETLQAWIGGYLVKIGPARGRRNRKQQYRLQLQRDAAQACLRQVYPYLLIKQRQADLVFEYFELAALRRASNLPGKRCDPGIVRRIEGIVAEMKRLNLRGLRPAKPAPVRPGRECAITTCVRPYYSSGYCKQHYKKYVERGGPAWHERRCVVCGKPFVAKRSDARACSKSCSDRAGYLARKKASRHSLSATQEAVVPPPAVEGVG